jgi:hypothetical protein
MTGSSIQVVAFLDEANDRFFRALSPRADTFFGNDFGTQQDAC